MTEVISIRFSNKGKVYFFAPNGLRIATGENVIVETSKGLEYADCTWGNHWVSDSSIVPPLRPVIRIATQEDRTRFENNKKLEKEAFEICQGRIDRHGIDMKLVDVEYNFERTKVLFFFTSDGRVDFRDLVKDLASVFHIRIELRQIGVRDEARMLGGLGICGKPFCCSQFLNEFHPVSIKMAKTQGLSLNPTKISGTCGRLMCCLKYEQFAYEDLVKKAPKIDAFVDTPGGKGSVTAVNLLRSNAKVKLEDGDMMMKTYAFDELEILGGKGRRAEYLTAKAEGKLEEAGFAPSQLRASKSELAQERREEEAPFVFADGTLKEKPEETPAAGNGQTPKANNRNRRKKPQQKSQNQPKPTQNQPKPTQNQQKPTQNQPEQKEKEPEANQPPKNEPQHRKKSHKPHKPQNQQSQPNQQKAQPAQTENKPAETAKDKAHGNKKHYYNRNHHKKPNKPKENGHTEG